MSAPFTVIVTVDCPSCGHDKASMDTARRQGRTSFMCESDTCLHLWVGEVAEPDTCGLGFRGGATCGQPPGHEPPCLPGGAS